MAKKAKSSNMKDTSANLGFEAKLWLAADKLRNNMDAAEYKHVVLGRVLEYFLTRFASAEGKNGGQFYTPSDIRQKLIEADLVDCMVALPGQLFYSTQIPACLWFVTRSKSGKKVGGKGG